MSLEQRQAELEARKACIWALGDHSARLYDLRVSLMPAARKELLLRGFESFGASYDRVMKMAARLLDELED